MPYLTDKIHQIQFWLGLCPRPHLPSSQTPSGIVGCDTAGRRGAWESEIRMPHLLARGEAIACQLKFYWQHSRTMMRPSSRYNDIINHCTWSDVTFRRIFFFATTHTPTDNASRWTHCQPLRLFRGRIFCQARDASRETYSLFSLSYSCYYSSYSVSDLYQTSKWITPIIPCYFSL